MNNKKFTPGPWRIDRETWHDCGYSRSSRAIVDPDGKPVLLFDPSDGEYVCAIDEDSSDVHLISATPELYEALEHLHAEQNGPPLEKYKKRWEEAMRKTEAALSKARGEA